MNRSIIETSDNNFTKRLLFSMLLIVVIVLCLTVAVVFGKNISKETVVTSLSYTEDIGDEYNRIPYLVYYKNNEFYTKSFYTINDSPYLGNLIDSIDIDFDYHILYSDAIYGNYKYNIIGTLVVYEPGNENEVIFTEDYPLVDEDMVSFNATDYRIQKTVTIDYQKYLDRYKAYSRESKLSSNAKFVVRFEVNNGGTYNSLPKIDKKAYAYITIPLTETTFKISETTNVTKDTRVIDNKVKPKTDYVFSIVIIALCIILAVVLGIILVVIYVNNKEKQSLYSRTLKKIISTYDNILVSVKKLPDTKDLNAINVTSFDELVDAQSEVRLPINYKEDKNKLTTKFILIRNDMAWIYTLKEGDLEDEKKA